jgi:hypothetical protein
VRDRANVGAEEKIRFTSSILPKWARRTKSLDALCAAIWRVPWPTRWARCGPCLQLRLSLIQMDHSICAIRGTLQVY